jgi:hypothetical protein
MAPSSTSRLAGFDAYALVPARHRVELIARYGYPAPEVSPAQVDACSFSALCQPLTTTPANFSRSVAFAYRGSSSWILVPRAYKVDERPVGTHFQRPDTTVFLVTDVLLNTEVNGTPYTP